MFDQIWIPHEPHLPPPISFELNSSHLIFSIPLQKEQLYPTGQAVRCKSQ